jgi:hypothetical protein
LTAGFGRIAAIAFSRPAGTAVNPAAAAGAMPEDATPVAAGMERGAAR